MYLEDIYAKSKLKGICVFESKITQLFDTISCVLALLVTIFNGLSLLSQDPKHPISFAWLAP
jgi:hypothetical protein